LAAASRDAQGAWVIHLDENHVYWVDGRQKPGVSSVLDYHGLIPQYAKDDNAALRGTLVHKACHLMAQGKLDFASIDMRIMGKVLAYARFLEETGFIPEELEAMHHQEDLDYCGTVDAFGYHRKLGPFIYDIKTGSPLKYHKLQVAAYGGFYQKLAERQSYFFKRATLFLRDDETYSLKFHDDPTDWNMWVSALNCMRLKEAS
jgi:hypothetical protein